jgi:hypothetical protein
MHQPNDPPASPPAPSPDESVEGRAAVSPAAASETTPAPPPPEASPEFPTTAHQEPPMLDVHPPHEPIHSWKEYLLHMSTIVLGLLIAISLEQSVEWLHHLHQRHQLEEDLHAEDLLDHDQVQGDLRTYEVRRVWMVGLRDQVDRMRASGGKLKLPYPPEPLNDPVTKQPLSPQTIPSDSVWSTAKESALVVLLPRAEAQMYARHARQHDFLMDAANAWIAVGTELIAFEDRFDDAGPKSTPDLSRMGVTDLDEYSKLLSLELAMQGRVVFRLNNFDGQTRAILNGARTEQELIFTTR